jgi:RNA polymerase sigma-70 factor, ECF subfamily
MKTSSGSKKEKYPQRVSNAWGGELSNDALIRGLLDGTPTAAEQFHHRFSARISRWVWRLLGADSEHDDVVQQVFVNVIGSLHRITKPDCLESWVDSVTIKTVRYEIRKRKIKHALLGTLFQTSECPSEVQDTNSPFKERHIKICYDIMKQIPTDDRILLVLRYLEGCSVDQIAATGNYSRSTAKRRLKRALGRFQKAALQDFSLISLVEECHAT